MQKQRHYYNHFLTFEKSIPNFSKAINEQKRRIKTPGKISLLIPPLQTHLMGNNNFLPTKPTKKTWVILLISTMTRRVTIQQSIPSQKKTKIS